MFFGNLSIVDLKFKTFQVIRAMMGVSILWEREPYGPASLIIQFQVNTGGLLPHKILSFPLGNEHQPIILSEGDTEHTLTGLEWNTQYDVTVKSISGSTESTSLTARVWTSPSNYPTGLSAIPYSSNSILLTWNTLSSEPASIGGGYELEISDDGENFDFPEIVLSGMNSLNWIGLLDNTEYYFRIRSININLSPHENGTTSWSPSVSSITDALALDEIPPIPPHSLSAIATSDTTALLNASTTESGGILYWFVSLSSTQPINITSNVNSEAWYSTTPTLGVNSISASGLTPDMSYYLHVAHTDSSSNISAITTSSIFTMESEPAISLKTNLVSWWNLSGDLTDSHIGGHHLSGSAISSTIGPFGDSTGAISASSTSYAGVVHTDFDSTGSFSIVCWVSEGSSSSSCDYLINKGGSASASRAWIINCSDSGGGDDVEVAIYNSSGAAASSYGGLNGFFATNPTWYHLGVVYDSSLQTMNIYKNGVLFATQTSSDGVPTSIQPRVGYPFSLFRRSDNGITPSITEYLTGTMKLSRLGFWSRPITSLEIATIYNSGSDTKYLNL